MSNEAIRRLYEEAARLHTQAKAILDEFKGKEDTMPSEKSAQVDALLDQVEAKTATAKRMEREEAANRFLNDPTTRQPLFGGKQAPAATDEVKLALAAFVCKGYGGMSDSERKALLAGEATSGGYLIQDTWINELLTTQREMLSMRSICRVLPPVPVGSAVVPTASNAFSDAEWTAEIAVGSDETAKPFGQRRLTPHDLSKLVRVSNTQLRNPTLDVEAWVRQELALKFNAAEENGFINGTGAQQPLGLLNTPSLPTFTTVTSNEVNGNDVINWVYKLPASYAGRPSTRIICNRAFVRKIRTLYTPANGVSFTNYIWQPGLAPGEPDRILDTVYVFSDKFDDGLDANDVWEDNAVIAVIGDFNYYWIQDAQQLSIQRLVEAFFANNQTGFLGRKACDGMAVVAEAFYALKVKA